MQYNDEERSTDLPFTQRMVRRLALEAEARDLRIGEFLGDLVMATMKEDLLQRVLAPDPSQLPSKYRRLVVQMDPLPRGQQSFQKCLTDFEGKAACSLGPRHSLEKQALERVFRTNGLAASRTQSMNVCTTGLSVRFFNVTTATWKNRVTKSTGSTLSEKRSMLNRTTEPGSDATKRSVASKLRRW